MTDKANKPLGGRVYGSIPHLLGSKLGEGDHHIHKGQHRICTEKTRDKNDLVIVQEKYDGSNVCVAKVSGEILALTRRGYLAETSPFEQHHYFAKWVQKNNERFSETLADGDRICGEWLLQAHGIQYLILDEPFVVFDYFEGDKRLGFEDFLQKINAEFIIPKIAFIGFESVGVEIAFALVNDHVAQMIKPMERPEGLIYRVERKGKLDFIAKWVRPDFETGKYLPEISGKPEVWNFDPWELLVGYSKINLYK